MSAGRPRSGGSVSLGLLAGWLILATLAFVTWRGAGEVPLVWRTHFIAGLHPPIPGDPAQDDAALRFQGVSLRQFVPLPAPAPRWRLRLSNEYGDGPLEIGALHVAWRAAATGTALRPGSDRAVSFGGQPSVSIPPGRSVWSDPFSLPAGAPADLAVSLYLPGPSPRASWHPVGGRSSYVSAPGRHLGEAPFPAAQVDRRLLFLAEVEAEAVPDTALWVAFGDSITLGAWHPVDTDTSYPAVWAAIWRQRSPTAAVVVLNAGIGGNRLLSRKVSDAGLERLGRDALDLPGVHGLVLQIGINDLGAEPRPGEPPVDAQALIAGQTELLQRARARGLKVVGATLLPIKGSFYFRPEVEAERQVFNAWVRSTPLFDAVVDFDAVVRDPADPLAIRADWTDDRLHPTEAGYRAMAQALVHVLDQAGLAPRPR